MLSCHLPNEPASPSFLQSTRPKPGLPVKAAALAAGGAALLALAGYFMFAEPRVISDTAIAETDADSAACDKSNRPIGEWAAGANPPPSFTASRKTLRIGLPRVVFQ